MSHYEVDHVIVEDHPSRRSYLGWLIGLCSGAVGAVLSIPLVRFALYPLTAKTVETKWSDVGAASEFAAVSKPVQRSVTVQQVDGWRKTVSEKVVYVTKDPAGKLRVLSAICPHLGCSVQWNTSKDTFLCPCHGASFTSDGRCTGGPASRAMDALESTVQGDRLVVHYRYYRQLVPEKEVIG